MPLKKPPQTGSPCPNGGAAARRKLHIHELQAMLAHDPMETLEALSGANIKFYIMANIADPAIAMRQKVFGALASRSDLGGSDDNVDTCPVCVEELNHANSASLEQSSGAVGMFKTGKQYA